MNKKVLITILVVLLIICCGIPLGFWIYSAANTKPTCAVVDYTGENNLSTYVPKKGNANDPIDIRFELAVIKTLFMSKSTELFGTGKDYKCPESLSELNITTSKTTTVGTPFEIIYKKIGDYSANVGAKIDGKEYYQ